MAVSSRWDDGLFREHDTAQPPVLGLERAGQEAGQDLQQAYVPCADRVGRNEDVPAELRELADGQVVLLAYSSLEALVECCGEAQPWALVSVAALDEVLEGTAASMVLWDQALPPEQRQD